MSLLKNPYNLNNDLISFIIANYPTQKLPNSLLIAQAFILKNPQYGYEYGLTAVNRAIEAIIRKKITLLK